MKITKPGILIMTETTYDQMLRKIESAGRTCYKSEAKISKDSAEKFIRGIIKSGHESVIEHESITVRVTCDRGVTHEIVRHRLASYSQESTRYCNYGQDKFGNEISVIDISTGFKYDLDNEQDLIKYRIWKNAMEMAESAYFEMLDAGAKPEEARSVLPNSLKTEIVMTMDIRAWRNFFKLRSDSHAHPQMREVSDMILKEFKEKYPVFFEDLKLSDES